METKKMWVPTIGDEITLTSTWTFGLYHEYSKIKQGHQRLSEILSLQTKRGYVKFVALRMSGLVRS